MAVVSMKNVCKTYEDALAVDHVNLTIEQGEFLVLTGPTGCGKSSLLRMVAGLEEVTSGEVYIRDSIVNNISPKERNVAVVFQNYSLYPHLNVYQNIAFNLQLQKVPRREIQMRVEEVAQLLEIACLLNRKPRALSGGQRQKVALGRAMVREPEVFLLDEPLANLDEKYKREVRGKILQVKEKTQAAFLYITHDQNEAMAMGDRIVVMRNGRVEQVDTPFQIYNRPCNMFVAEFFGMPSMNFVNAVVIEEKEKLYAKNGGLKIPLWKTDGMKKYCGENVVLGVRPQDIRVVHRGEEHLLQGKVVGEEFYGVDQYMHVDCGGMLLMAKTEQVLEQSEVYLNVDARLIHVFDPQTQSAVHGNG